MEEWWRMGIVGLQHLMEKQTFPLCSPPLHLTRIYVLAAELLRWSIAMGQRNYLNLSSAQFLLKIRFPSVAVELVLNFVPKFSGQRLGDIQ